MKEKIMFKKQEVIIGLVILAVVGVIASGGWTAWWKFWKDGKRDSNVEIVVYRQGEKIVLDSQSPYFRELQRACENTLLQIKDIFIPMKGGPDEDKIKTEEWAIEVTYSKPKRLRVKGIELFQLFIPLTGESAEITYKDHKYVHLIFFQGDIKTPGKISESGEYLFSPKKNIQKIKEILTKFNLDVP